MDNEAKSILRPFTFKNGLAVKNRVAMAPMTTWASNDDYTVSEDEINHYRTRVQDVGMVITGCTRVMANGIGFTHEFAAYSDEYLPGLKKLADAAKSGGAPAILQIYHAGNKAVAELIPNNTPVSASAVETGSMPFVKGEHIPRALTHTEILEVITAFGETTRRAIQAGFDGVELHGAHGFLLQNFFSPVYNLRNDYWGGSAENRMHFPLEVVKEVQRTIAQYADRPFLLGYRISPEEPQPESYKTRDIYPLIDELIRLDIDYLHLSLQDILHSLPLNADGGETIAELIVSHVNSRLPIIAAGGIRQPNEAAKALEIGLDMVAIGQALVMNPDWLEKAAKGELAEEVLDLSKATEMALPEKLLTVIDAAKGWFRVKGEKLEV